MTSKEIMVGDWVAFRGHPYQYTADDIAAIAEHEVKGLSTDTTEIPLTEEILNNNGFRFLVSEIGKYKTHVHNNPYISCTFVTDSRTWMITVGAAGSTKKRFVEVSMVKYVHELQHALKLCGIEKEIIL